jgi:hypothetical protein
MERDPRGLTFTAPFACPGFTVRVSGIGDLRPAFSSTPLKEVRRALDLTAGTWVRMSPDVGFGIDLPKGRSRLTI